MNVIATCHTSKINIDNIIPDASACRSCAVSVHIPATPIPAPTTINVSKPQTFLRYHWFSCFFMVSKKNTWKKWPAIVSCIFLFPPKENKTFSNKTLLVSHPRFLESFRTPGTVLVLQKVQLLAIPQPDFMWIKLDLTGNHLWELLFFEGPKYRFLVDFVGISSFLGQRGRTEMRELMGRTIMIIDIVTIMNSVSVINIIIIVIITSIIVIMSIIIIVIIAILCHHQYYEYHWCTTHLTGKKKLKTTEWKH